jgi:hypothetical protein
VHPSVGAPPLTHLRGKAAIPPKNDFAVHDFAKPPPSIQPFSKKFCNSVN